MLSVNYVRLCICIRTCHSCTLHALSFIDTYVRMLLHTPVHICMLTHQCTYIHTYVYMYIAFCAYSCTARTYVHTYVCTAFMPFHCKH